MTDNGRYNTDNGRSSIYIIGDITQTMGDVPQIMADTTQIIGEVPQITGDTTQIIGDVA